MEFASLIENPGSYIGKTISVEGKVVHVCEITGLFIVKGRNGITKRGAILTGIGMVLPLLFLFIY